VSIASIRLCDSVCLSVCPHNKIKTIETKIAHQLILGQKVKGQGHRVNKKDGYRQQNVRQRQKLISILDYDVCILEYLHPFWRYSTSKNGLTLKSGYGVLQGH